MAAGARAHGIDERKDLAEFRGRNVQAVKLVGQLARVHASLEKLLFFEFPVADRTEALVLRPERDFSRLLNFWLFFS